MKSVYVSGPIKDHDGYFDKFDAAEKSLAADGWHVVNPCTITEAELTYEQYMRMDILAELECDAIYMLKGWERSAGARCEHLVAAMCGLEIMYQ